MINQNKYGRETTHLHKLIFEYEIRKFLKFQHLSVTIKLKSVLHDTNISLTNHIYHYFYNYVYLILTKL